MNNTHSFLKNYSGILWLLSGILVGSIAGIIWGEKVAVIKPIGDIFINLLFTAVVPLVFFCIVSAVANIDRSQKFGRILGSMFFVFVCTLLIAAFVTVLIAWLFPFSQATGDGSIFSESVAKQSAGEALTQLLTTSDFYILLSRKNMLALIIFSLLIGFAILRAGDKGKPFHDFIDSGMEVMKHVLLIIMKVAPVGLGAYFAYQVGTIGPQLFGTYAKALALFHGVGIFYFIVFFSLYAFIAGGAKGIALYWKNNIVPGATAISTCSSIATIPANLDAAKKMRIPPYIGNLVVPLGAALHKEGSSISAVTKIVVVFAMFHKSFTGIDTVALALGLSIIASIVEGGIPNGGYVGELLIISAYGLPVEAIPAVMIIGTLVDPLATVLNATGDTVAGMLITRMIEGKDWMEKEVVG
jgi:Na+/H+-dicarboxylate symporter